MLARLIAILYTPGKGERSLCKLSILINTWVISFCHFSTSEELERRIWKPRSVASNSCAINPRRISRPVSTVKNDDVITLVSEEEQCDNGSRPVPAHNLVHVSVSHYWINLV